MSLVKKDDKVKSMNQFCCGYFGGVPPPSFG